jgi:hypothetical protein
MSRPLPFLLASALALLLLTAPTALAHGHGGYVVASGPAAAISAPATRFYGGYAPTTYVPNYGPGMNYGAATSGYPFTPGTTYLMQPTGAYVPGAAPYPTNYGYTPTVYPASFGRPYGGWMPASGFRRLP